MIEKINHSGREITVSLLGDTGELHSYQQALIDLLQNYNYEKSGGECAETVYYGLGLLSELLPNEEVQRRIFINDADYLELPESMTEQGREMIREALFMLAHPEVKVRQEANPIHQILISQQRN